MRRLSTMSGKPGDGLQRKTFTTVVRATEAAEHPAVGGLPIVEAAVRIRALLSPVSRGRRSWCAHRPPHRGGVRVIDEHTLEARLLNGLTPIGSTANAELVRDDHVVARGS